MAEKCEVCELIVDEYYLFSGMCEIIICDVCYDQGEYIAD